MAEVGVSESLKGGLTGASVLMGASRVLKRAKRQERI